MTNPTNVELLDDLVGESSDNTEATATDTTNESETSNESSETTTNERDPETLTEVPEGLKVKSITEFAAHMTGEMMKAAVEAGEPIDPQKHYVVPQSVYQTVKAQKDRIPHIKVQAPGDEQARVYIKVDEATPWWLERAERLSTRGQGTARASSREPEDNLRLLAEAVKANLHAIARKELWTERVEQSLTKIDKYRGFLGEQNISEEDVAVRIQTATDEYNAELAEKAKNRKNKSDTTD